MSGAAAAHASARRAASCAVLIAASALAMIAIPVWGLIVPGPFDWHIRLPEFWQGGIEALALAVLVASGFALNRNGWLIVLAGVPSLLYLRRHAVDVPALIDLAYFEIVIGLGMAARRLLRLPAARGSEDYLHALVLGFIGWSLAAWSLSALGFGSIKQLRWLTALLALAACYGRSAPLVFHLWRRVRVEDRLARVCCGLIAAWLAILFARSNVVVGYDPIWYGLRAEYVLDPGHSLFEPLGLTSPVYYFPKLYEAFLLPVSALRDFSVIDGLTILLLVPTLIASRTLMQRLGTPGRAQWPMLVAIVTLPALANSAIAPKPDGIAMLWVLLAAVAALDAARTRAVGAGVWLAVCALLACLSKLTAIPYVAALAAATAFSAWRRSAIADEHPPIAYPSRLVRTALVGASLVAAFVTARTWLLTGMPTVGPDPLVRLWRALGMDFIEPTGTLRWAYPVKWADLPLVVFDVLLRPYHDLPHMIITWVGNVWLWLAFVAVAAGALLRPALSARHGTAALPLAALAATGLGLFVGVGYGSRGSDGNYFLCAVVPVMMVAWHVAFRRVEAHARVTTITVACVAAFALFHASYAFVSAGWHPGTRAFDAKLGRGWHDTKKLRERSLEGAGLARIAAYLKALPLPPHAVGLTLRSSGYWLPARYESLDQIFYARPEYLASGDAFLKFLARQHIGYLILPLPTALAKANDIGRIPASIDAAAARLAELPGVRRIDDDAHFLLDFSALASDVVESGSTSTQH